MTTSERAPGSDFVRVRRLKATEVEEFRALRLHALSEDPDAFGSTLERESGYDDRHWSEWTSRGATSPSESTWVAVGNDGGLVGMCGIFAQEGHSVLWGMWVDRRYRRRGVGSRLVGRLLDWQGAHHLPSEVRLSVSPTQMGALELYARLGFVRSGKSEASPYRPNATFHEMVRSVSD
jgi:ribosomal protein S18 acetylase RimI-like enzyme